MLKGVYMYQSAGVCSPCAAASISADSVRSTCLSGQKRWEDTSGHECSRTLPTDVMHGLSMQAYLLSSLSNTLATTLDVHASKKQTQRTVCASRQ